MKKTPSLEKNSTQMVFWASVGAVDSVKVKLCKKLDQLFEEEYVNFNNLLIKGDLLKLNYKQN